NRLPTMQWIKRFVSERRSTTLSLTNPAGATLTIGPMKDTEYKDKPEEVNGCSKFYLPTKLQFQVIGYVEGVSFTCEQLILMINENGEFYGYDGDQMHLVASSIEELIQNGLDYPSSKSYYYGEAFKDMLTCHDDCRVGHRLIWNDSDSNSSFRFRFLLIPDSDSLKT
uniref:Uncharacterized protein n=1 Tax=Nothobranchius furzeri TaxID=105023 RepID=A0A8C6PHZ1_NOTFU